MGKVGVLLLNLGTPDHHDTKSVRRYLREFLMDPHVVDIPWIGRFLLVHGIILPTRPKRSAEAYGKVWTERGSPLLFHTLDLASHVQTALGDEYRVIPVMRYGNPSVASAMETLKAEGIAECIAMPLYPQFSLAASHSSIEWVKREATRLHYKGNVHFVPAFYRDENFIAAFAERVKESATQFKPDHYLFSFHGLPERQIRRVDPTGGRHCLATENCSLEMNDQNRDCYRAQSYYTARKIAESLGIPSSQYEVGFQSRLGRTPWIKPYSDVILKDLAQGGKVRRVLVCSPSFVADCLETLEEIAIRGRADFIAGGGEDLGLVPSLNSTPAWVNCVSNLVRNLKLESHSTQARSLSPEGYSSLSSV